jgi:hypothetical protein
MIKHRNVMVLQYLLLLYIKKIIKVFMALGGVLTSLPEVYLFCIREGRRDFWPLFIVMKKMSQISVWGDALCLQYEPLTYLKFFWSSVYKLGFLSASFSRCKILRTYCPGPTRSFFINFWYAILTFSCMRSALWTKKIVERLLRGQ